MNQSELEIKTYHRCQGRENMKHVPDAESGAKRANRETDVNATRRKGIQCEALKNVPKLSVDWILFC